MISLLVSLVLLIKLIDGSGRVYNVVNQLKTASDATAYCSNEYGTDLATVIDENDYQAIRDAKLAAGVETSAPVIIGLHDVNGEGKFEWDDGTPCTNMNDVDLCIAASTDTTPQWGPGEPNNNSGGLKEDCVTIATDNTAQPLVFYNDIPCDISDILLYFACNACDNCDEQASCLEIDGQHICQCNEGYEGDGRSGGCVDINECMVGNECINGDCINVVGTYICDCYSGYQPNESGKSCVDIDECDDELFVNLCGDRTECINNAGGYECIGDCETVVISCNDNQTRECEEDANGNLQCECIENVVPFISNYPYITLLIICLCIINIAFMYFTFCNKMKRKHTAYKTVLNVDSEEFSECEANPINV